MSDDEKIDHSEDTTELSRDLSNATDRQLANALERVTSQKGKWKDEDARADLEQKLKDEQARRRPPAKDADEDKAGG